MHLDTLRPERGQQPRGARTPEAVRQQPDPDPASRGLRELDGEVVGYCTSGGYSHWTGKSVAQGFIPAERVEDGLPLEIEI
ncbi:MAG: glycine cleavage T C-terminal barrel domain-containing protein, partial [Acidihalobacter sp.]